MTDFNFFRDGGNNALDIPLSAPYPMGTMFQLAHVLIVEHDLPHEVDVIVKRPQRFLDAATSGVITASISEELYGGIRRSTGYAFMQGTGVHDAEGVFKCEDIQRTQRALTGDAVIDLIYTTKASDRALGSFLCSELTLKMLKRLHDSDGRFLVEQALDATGIPKLMGYPLHVDPYAPDGHLMFGNFGAGYEIQARPYVKVIRDPFADKPRVVFMATAKITGRVTAPEALKMIWSGI
jgi:HK97 family phage major capsid protein